MGKRPHVVGGFFGVGRRKEEWKERPRDQAGVNGGGGSSVGGGCG